MVCLQKQPELETIRRWIFVENEINFTALAIVYFNHDIL